MLRANTYIGLNDDVLTYYGDKNDFYKDIFGWVLPAGIIFVPVSFIIIDHFYTYGGGAELITYI